MVYRQTPNFNTNRGNPSKSKKEEKKKMKGIINDKKSGFFATVTNKKMIYNITDNSSQTITIILLLSAPIIYSISHFLTKITFYFYHFNISLIKIMNTEFCRQINAKNVHACIIALNRKKINIEIKIKISLKLK